MKIRAEHPYYAASVAAWLGIGCSVWMITGNANSGMTLGLLAGAALVLYGMNKGKEYATDIENPLPRIFPVSEFEVFATIKDVLTCNIEDKWWVAKNVDDAPDEDGNMKMKYACNFEEPHPPVMGQTPPPLKRQIVLDVLVNRVSNHASAKLHFEVVSNLNRIAADDVLEKTTARIWQRLDKLVAMKAAGPTVKANASNEF